MFVSTFEQFIKNMKQKMRKFPSPQGRKLRTTGAYVTTGGPSSRLEKVNDEFMNASRVV